MVTKVINLRQEIAQCRICIDNPDKTPLPHEPRPVAVLSQNAKVLIVGQAPGTRVHASGRPFTDPSGDRLRDWMGIDETKFYNPEKLAIAPMGFCFPGLDEKGGDLPPRKECARHWQSQVLEAMPQVELLLLIGIYAQKYHLRDKAAATLTETVKNWRSINQSTSMPYVIPLPHPSWRNNSWIKKNPWFEAELIPHLQICISKLI